MASEGQAALAGVCHAAVGSGFIFLMQRLPAARQQVQLPQLHIPSPGEHHSLTIITSTTQVFMLPTNTLDQLALTHCVHQPPAVLGATLSGLKEGALPACLRSQNLKIWLVYLKADCASMRTAGAMADLSGSTAAAGEGCMGSAPDEKESKHSFTGVSNGGHAGCTAAAPPSLSLLLATRSLLSWRHTSVALTVVSAAWGDRTEQPTG